MCGEMAGDRLAIPLLLGLGLDEFSMSASKVLQSREIISKLSFSKCQEIANQALVLESEAEVKALLAKNGIK